jgi:hypothetical protein
MINISEKKNNTTIIKKFIEEEKIHLEKRINIININGAYLLSLK